MELKRKVSWKLIVIPRLTSFYSYVIGPQTKHIKQRAQILMYDAEGVFELLNTHDRELTLDDLVEIRKQSAFEEPEIRELEHKERTMRVQFCLRGLDPWSWPQCV